MSANTPSGPNGGGGPEYLGSAPPQDTGRSPGSGPRWPVLGAAAVAVAAVVGLGGWGAFALLSGGGAQPADAIPDSAVGYVSLDLDPSASQKIEAFKMLKKFPGIEKSLHLSSSDDLRRIVFDAVQDEGTCTQLDYDSDLLPWIGERVALAAVPEVKSAPVIALQVGDQDAARKGIAALAKCGEAGGDFGYAFSGDYVLITDSTKHAEALKADAAAGSLADDSTFQKWTDEVGDPGIMTMYAAPGAPAYFAAMADAGRDGWTGYSPGPPPSAAEHMKTLYRDFQGAAGTIRFDDGAVEAEFAGRGMPGMSAAGGTAPATTDLPASTAGAFSVALPDGWLDTVLRSVAAQEGGSPEQMLAEAEAETGLNLPEDIETLFGNGVTVSIDSGIDLRSLMQSGDLSRLPVGVRVSGDPDEILPAFEKVKTAIGPDGEMLVAQAGDGEVVLGANHDYLDTLLAGGSLGEEEAFQQVMPEADEPTIAVYLNFDAGNGWAEELANELSGLGNGFTGQRDTSAGDNVAPLDALGISTWAHDDVQRGMFRLTTD